MSARITPVECRQHAVECQRVAERASNLRRRSTLIDMSRTWQRLALEVEQSRPTNGSLLPYDPLMVLCQMGITLDHKQTHAPRQRTLCSIISRDNSHQLSIECYFGVEDLGDRAVFSRLPRPSGRT